MLHLLQPSLTSSHSNFLKQIIILKKRLKSVLSCDKHRTGGRGRGVECEILRDVEIWFPQFQANVPSLIQALKYWSNL